MNGSWLGAMAIARTLSVRYQCRYRVIGVCEVLTNGYGTGLRKVWVYEVEKL